MKLRSLYILSIIGLFLVVVIPVSYTHLRAHETGRNLVCRLLLEKKKKKTKNQKQKKKKKQEIPKESKIASR